MEKSKYSGAVSARWVVTMDSDRRPGPRTILENHTVLYNDGIIASIVPTETVEESMRTGSLKLKKYINLGTYSAIMPGLVNCHCHSPMSLLRGFADDYNLHDWLFSFIFPAENKLLSEVKEKYIKVGTQMAAIEGLKTGTTTIMEMYYEHDMTTVEWLKSGVRPVNSCHIIDLGQGEDVVMKQVNDAIAYCTKKDVPEKRSFALHSCYMVPAKYHKIIAEANKTLNVPYITHLNESVAEAEGCMKNSFNGKCTAVQTLQEAGALNPRFMGVHCVHLTPEEIRIFAETGSNVCHCPRSNSKLGSGICPVKALLDSGVNVCLGTDSACSNNSLDMLAEAHAATMMARGSNRDPQALTAYEALCMATRNGAKALGRFDEIGSLEVGKRADMIALDFSQPCARPILDVLNEIVMVSSRRVSDVWIGGKRVVDNGKCLTVEINNEDVEGLSGYISNLQKELKTKYNQEILKI